MAETSRVNGLIGSLGMKAPVRAATTANITLSGLQTVDGVVLAAYDRVLVKDQTDPTENGIYDVQSGAWTRSPDFDGARDAVTGTAVVVVSGATNAWSQWQVTTEGSIVPGTAIVFGYRPTAGRAGASAFDGFSAEQIADVQARTEALDVLLAIQTQIDGLEAAGGGVLDFPPGVFTISGPIVLPAKVYLQGAGSANTVIKLRPAANSNILETKNFASHTLQNLWLVSEGVQTGFGFDGIRFDGNRANQTVAGGVAIYGKKYHIGYDVQIVSCKGVGFYSECAYKGGEAVPDDQPEGYIGKLQVWESGQENIIYRGPHDQPIGDMYSALAGQDGVYDGVVFDGKVNVYQGITYVNGTVHSYASTGHGVVCKTQMMFNKVSGESNYKSGVVFETAGANWIGAYYTNANYLEAYHNDVNGTGLYWNFENRVTGTTIGNIRFTTSTACAGSLYNTGTNLTIHGGVMLAANAVAHGVGYKNAADNANVRAQIILWDNAADTAFESGDGSFCHFNLNFLNCNNGKIWLNSGVSIYSDYVLHSASASGTPFTNTGTLGGTNTINAKITVNGVPYLSKYTDILRAITTGNTSLTVTHNAFRTPTPAEIHVTPSNDWRYTPAVAITDTDANLGATTQAELEGYFNAPKARTWWISNITATTFDINTDVAAVAGLEFYWQLSIGG